MEIGSMFGKMKSGFSELRSQWPGISRDFSSQVRGMGPLLNSYVRNNPIKAGLGLGAIGGLGYGMASSVMPGDQSQLGAIGFGMAGGVFATSKYGRGLSAMLGRSGLAKKVASKRFSSPTMDYLAGGMTKRTLASNTAFRAATIGAPALIGATVLSSNQGYR